jgi:hypothetical protein
VSARPRTAFGAYLQSLMAARSITARTLARLVGVSPAFITLVQRVPMPLSRVATWADALDLSVAERARFEHLALLTHTPPQICVYVAALERRVAQLEAPVSAVPRRRGGRTGRG